MNDFDVLIPSTKSASSRFTGNIGYREMLLFSLKLEFPHTL